MQNATLSGEAMEISEGEGGARWVGEELEV